MAPAVAEKAAPVHPAHPAKPLTAQAEPAKPDKANGCGGGHTCAEDASDGGGTAQFHP